MRRFVFFFILIFLFGSQLSGFSQVSVNLSTDDPVYREIDQLVGHGLISKIIFGQRPYSRTQIARFILEAEQNLKTLEEKLDDPDLSSKKKSQAKRRYDWISKKIDRLKKEYQNEYEAIKDPNLASKSIWKPLDQLRVQMNLNSSKSQTIPPTGLGLIDAEINPMLQNQEGRRLVEGTNLAFESSHWVKLGKHAAFYLEPRFQLAFDPEHQNEDHTVYLHKLYAKFLISNLEIEIGRDHLLWGQGEKAGLLLSGNAPGLDMIKISNEHLFRFPWIFKYLGDVKASFVYSDLGPNQNFPHAYLATYKLSLKPRSFFEIGTAVLVQGGGEGSPDASIVERIIDVFPLIDAVFILGKDLLISNKFAGIDFRFTIPKLRQAQFYGEIYFDDIGPGRLKSLITQDAGYIAGFFLPRLDDLGRVSLRLEYHRTGIRYYRHATFISGLSRDGFLLGDPLGPDADALYTNLIFEPNLNHLIDIEFAFERRSNDEYTSIEDGQRFDLIKTEDRPEEDRYRILAAWQYRSPKHRFSSEVKVGFEHIERFNFKEDQDRNQFLGAIELKWKF